MHLKDLSSQYPNRTAFITGAASGLGKAFAHLLAKEGWKLHLADLDHSLLQETVEGFGLPDEVNCYQLDVSDLSTYTSVVEQVYMHSEKVDLLINNAGIGDGGLFQSYNMLDWKNMLNINLLGTVYGCHLFTSRMIKAQSGLIINIGSAAGFMNAPGMSAYNVSKAAVYSFSETIFHELKSENIKVSVVTPTFFKSNVMQQAKGSDSVIAFAEKQMKYSTTNADELSLITLHKAALGKFHIIHPKEARRSFFFKKWLPNLVTKKFVKMKRKLTE